MNLEAQEILEFAQRKIAVVDRIIHTNEVLVPKSDEQDARMRELVLTHVSDIRITGIENLRTAIQAANEAGVVLATERNHQSYFDIATMRAALESEGEKVFADTQVFPAGLEIYELYRGTHFPANEISVMVIAPQDSRTIAQGLNGNAFEFTNDQIEILKACSQALTRLTRLSLRALTEEVAKTRRLCFFPETEFPPVGGLTQRPKPEVAPYYKKPDQINLPIRTDGPHLIFGPDTINSPLKPKTFVEQVRIGRYFSNAQVEKALAAVPENFKIYYQVNAADIAFKPVAYLNRDRVDPSLHQFFDALPSVYDYAA